MRLLLDTHIWIWSLLEPTKLPARAAQALAGTANQLWLSPISLWEFFVLVEKGRIRLLEAPERWIDMAFEKAPINEAPLSNEIVRASRRVDLHHQDPADRFIAATAQVLNLTLVTADERLLRAKGVPTLS